MRRRSLLYPRSSSHVGWPHPKLESPHARVYREQRALCTELRRQHRAALEPKRVLAVDLYEQRTGLTVRNLRYYQIWAAFRAALLLFRFNDMLVGTGVLPPDADKAPHLPAVAVMRALVDQ